MSTHYLPPPRPPGNGLNVASMVLGILSLVIPFLGIVTAPLAVIFAFAVGRERNGMGVAGLVTGLVALAGYLAWAAFLVAVALQGASAA